MIPALIRQISYGAIIYVELRLAGMLCYYQAKPENTETTQAQPEPKRG